MALSKQERASLPLDRISEANNTFALHLYQTLQDEQRGKNLFFSPLSISTAMAMTYLGARGETATQMADAFRFNQVDGDRLHTTFKELNRILYGSGEGYQLCSANKLYVKFGFPVVQNFLDGTGSFYGAAIEAVDDFASPSAAKSINDWVSKQTEGKITDLIAPGVLNDLTRLILVNAIYFKGNWSSRFREENTIQDTFKVIDDRKSVPVRLMFQEDRFPVFIDKTNDCVVLEMPYQGKNLGLLIALPNKDDGLSELESKLSADTLKSWDSGLNTRQVKVFLPKFKLNTDFQMNNVLKSMGVSDAFDESTANFEGISGDRELFISNVIHQASFDVNERGSEAAAATAVEITLCCAYYTDPANVIQVRADHPFFFMIRHKFTKSVLFVGRMMDPLKSAN